MGIQICRYQESDSEVWDRFILNNAANGTIFHTRKFISYHPEERYKDRSLLIYDSNKLAALFPVAVSDGNLFSHPGTTGGGVVVSQKYNNISKLNLLFSSLREYFGGQIPGMRIQESIFFDSGNDFWIYLLNKTHELLPEIGVYKSLQYEDPVKSVTRSSNRTYIRRTLEAGFTIKEASNTLEYEYFYDLLCKNLLKFDNTPTHTLGEFFHLAELLGEGQKLLLGVKDDRIVSGMWLINAKRTIWHNQYMAKDYSVDELGLMPATIIMSEYYLKNRYNATQLNYGICTEDQGRDLNVGLCGFKESLGGMLINRYIAIPS